MWAPRKFHGVCIASDDARLGLWKHGPFGCGLCSYPSAAPKEIKKFIFVKKRKKIRELSFGGFRLQVISDLLLWIIQTPPASVVLVAALAAAVLVLVAEM